MRKRRQAVELLFREINTESDSYAGSAFSVYAMGKYLFAISHPGYDYDGKYYRLFILRQTEEFNFNSHWDEVLCETLAEALYRDQHYKIFDTGFSGENKWKYIGNMGDTLYFAFPQDCRLHIKRYGGGCAQGENSEMVDVMNVKETEQYNKNTVWDQALFKRFARIYFKTGSSAIDL